MGQREISRYIRGVKASASLKLGSNAYSAGVSPGYPRCKSLGLIEARRGRGADGRVYAISEV